MSAHLKGPKITSDPRGLSSHRFERFSSWKVLYKAEARLIHIARSYCGKLDDTCKGACKELKINVNDSGLNAYLKDTECTWIFNPPHASHMDESWERLIGVARRILDTDFAAFVEWTLARNRSSLTIRPEENLASATPDPEPSPPSPRCVEQQPEPTADGEPEPHATDEPSPRSATELRIASEPEPRESDQVREPATEHATVENATDSESVEWSSAHCTKAEGELITYLGLLDLENELIDWETELELDPAPFLPPSSPLVPSSPLSSPLVLSSPPSSPLVPSSPEVVPETPVHASQEHPPVPAPHRRPPVPAPQEHPPVPAPRRRPPVLAPQERPPEFSPEDIHKVLPTHPFLSTPLLFPVSPTAHPQPNICVLDSPWVCQSPSASWLEDPSSLPPASESRTPPRPFDPSAPPWLLAPSSPPWPISPPAPPGSLVPPAPPWSVVDHPPALSGSSLPPAPPQSSVAPAPPR
ncbi:hypothetical protein QQF64_020402 [Cirrhinus molitorella]|uniref:Uncharacterized protein n=1 Tax=Cirrhinus molitorella TaxID=172907 RepID=A0ABR3L984_9TELE